MLAFCPESKARAAAPEHAALFGDVIHSTLASQNLGGRLGIRELVAEGVWNLLESTTADVEGNRPREGKNFIFPRGNEGDHLSLILGEQVSMVAAALGPDRSFFEEVHR